MKKSILWARNHLGSLLIVLAAYAAVYGVDLHVFPVVTDFFVERIAPAPKGAFIEGTMKKARNCRFIEIVVLTSHVVSAGRPVTYSLLR